MDIYTVSKPAFETHTIFKKKFLSHVNHLPLRSAKSLFIVRGKVVELLVFLCSYNQDTLRYTFGSSLSTFLESIFETALCLQRLVV